MILVLSLDFIFSCSILSHLTHLLYQLQIVIFSRPIQDIINRDFRNNVRGVKTDLTKEKTELLTPFV